MGIARLSVFRCRCVFDTLLGSHNRTRLDDNDFYLNSIFFFYILPRVSTSESDTNANLHNNFKLSVVVKTGMSLMHNCIYANAGDQRECDENKKEEGKNNTTGCQHRHTLFIPYMHSVVIQRHFHVPGEYRTEHLTTQYLVWAKFHTLFTGRVQSSNKKLIVSLESTQFSKIIFEARVQMNIDGSQDWFVCTRKCPAAEAFFTNSSLSQQMLCERNRKTNWIIAACVRLFAFVPSRWVKSASDRLNTTPTERIAKRPQRCSNVERRSSDPSRREWERANEWMRPK